VHFTKTLWTFHYLCLLQDLLTGMLLDEFPRSLSV
jgi:hypothetical protein